MDISANNDQGFDHLQRGELDEARVCALRSLELDPFDPGALLLAANVDVQCGALDEAIAVLGRGEVSRPDDVIFPYNIACLLVDLGRPVEAIAAFERASGKSDVTAEVMFDFGTTLAGQGDLRRAQGAFMRASELDASHEPAREALTALSGQLVDNERRMIKHAQFLDAAQRFPAPHIGFAGKPNGPHINDLVFDDWGFLNESLPALEKSPDEWRVFLLGDSTMCRGKNLAATVPSLAQEELRRRGRDDVKIYNFSVVSSRAMQMLSLLFMKLVDYKPDVVVIVCGGAELYVPLTYDPRPGVPYNFYVIEELYARFFDFANSGNEEGAVGFTELFSGVARRQSELRAKVGMDASGEWEVEAIDSFTRFLSKLDRLASAFEFDASVMLQPLVNTKVSITPLERAMCSPTTFDYFQRQYGRLREVMFSNGRTCGEWSPNIATYDSTDVFDGEAGDIYEDFIHYNPIGDALMASRVADVVLERLKRAGQRNPARHALSQVSFP